MSKSVPSSIHTFENNQNETIHMAYQEQIQSKNYIWQMAMQSWLTIIIKSLFMTNFFIMTPFMIKGKV